MCRKRSVDTRGALHVVSTALNQIYKDAGSHDRVFMLDTIVRRNHVHICTSIADTNTAPNYCSVVRRVVGRTNSSGIFRPMRYVDVIYRK